MAEVNTRKILILGSSGMLGNAMLRLFCDSAGLDVRGTVRRWPPGDVLPRSLHSKVICGVDVESADALTRLFAEIRPDVVINCVGVVKQLVFSARPPGCPACQLHIAAPSGQAL